MDTESRLRRWVVGAGGRPRAVSLAIRDKRPEGVTDTTCAAFCARFDPRRESRVFQSGTRLHSRCLIRYCIGSAEIDADLFQRKTCFPRFFPNEPGELPETDGCAARGEDASFAELFNVSEIHAAMKALGKKPSRRAGPSAPMRPHGRPEQWTARVERMVFERFFFHPIQLRPKIKPIPETAQSPFFIPPQKGKPLVGGPMG